MDSPEQDAERPEYPQIVPLTQIPALKREIAERLREAGWATTLDLRRATLADLLSVPAVDEATGRQLLEFANTGVWPAAAPGPAQRDVPASQSDAPQDDGIVPLPDAAQDDGIVPQPGAAQDEGPAPASAEPPLEPSPVAASEDLAASLAASIVASASLLLEAERTTPLRPRLAKQLTRLGNLPERLPAALDAETRARLERGLCRISGPLDDAAARADLSRRRQDRLARRLRDARRRLKPLLGKPDGGAAA